MVSYHKFFYYLLFSTENSQPFFPSSWSPSPSLCLHACTSSQQGDIFRFSHSTLKESVIRLFPSPSSASSAPRALWVFPISSPPFLCSTPLSSYAGSAFASLTPSLSPFLLLSPLMGPGADLFDAILSFDRGEEEATRGTAASGY